MKNEVQTLRVWLGAAGAFVGVPILLYIASKQRIHNYRIALTVIGLCWFLAELYFLIVNVPILRSAE